MKTVKVKSVKIVDKSSTVCDIGVADNHNLFVAHQPSDIPILAHNCYPWHVSNFQITESRRRGPQYSRFLRTVCELGSDIILTFVEMERNGSLVDLEYLNSLMVPGNPLEVEMQKLADKFYRSAAMQQANKIIRRKIGVPENSHGLFGVKHNNMWVLDVNKPKHQQILFFRVLKLQPLDFRKDGGGKTNKIFLQEYQDSVPEVKALADWRSYEKLRNTYVTGLFKILTSHLDNSTDRRMRAFYNFIYILTVRSCLTPETPIYVLDDRGIVPIKHIKAGDWVWAFNKNLQPVPAQVGWSGRTKKARTVTVMYQGYNEHSGRGYGGIVESIKTIECSADHRFRLRDGNYRRADKLQPGDRVLALERHYNKDGYRRLFWTGMGKRRVLEHQYIIDHRTSYVTHHENEIPDDNRPDNLVEMTQNEHMKAHDFHTYAERAIHRSRLMRKLYRQGILVPLRGKDALNYRPLTRSRALRILQENKWHPTAFRDKYGWDYATAVKKLKELGIDYQRERQRFNGDDEYITDVMLNTARKLNSVGKAATYLKVNYYKAKDLLAEDRNHIIIKVTKNKHKKWLYDLEIPKYHNFIANGVCVHNSSQNPNLQNIPSRGMLAKIIKRLFITAYGCLLVKADYSAHEVRGWSNISEDNRIAQAFVPGMLLRRALRLLRLRDTQLDADLEDWLVDNNWEDIKELADKRELIKKTRNRPDLHAALELIIDLDIRGDVHRMNYEFFFKVSAANVSKEQRQSVKEVVFGTIYEKQALALAHTLYAKEIRPIARKYIARINRAKQDEDDVTLRTLQNQFREEIQPHIDQAQGLIDKLFNKFKRGGRWIRKFQKDAARNLYIVSPFGAVRHLWGYMHSEYQVHRVMDRRAPNSSIQGSSSNLGFTAARKMNKLNWEILKRGIDLLFKHTNFVHDSIEAEAAIAMLPLTLYYMEHSLLSQTHARARKTYGYKMLIGLEADLEIGACHARMQGWSGTLASLLRIVGEEIDWMRKELHYKLDKPELLACVEHNQRIIGRYRARELQAMGSSYAPDEAMLLTPEKVAGITWKLPNGKVKTGSELAMVGN